MRSSEQGLVLRGAVELEDGQSQGDYGDVTVESRLPVWLIRRSQLALVHFRRPYAWSLTDLHVDLGWTVSDLKERIRAQSSGKSVEGIVLACKLLRDDQSLREAGIRQGSRLFLGLPFSMRIFVKLLNGKDIRLQVDQAMFVEDLKEMIANREGIPIKDQDLGYAGKPLRDGTTLGDYSMQKDCTVRLRFRICG
jgi:hypothetical protein